jgi:hypothetical protein
VADRPYAKAIELSLLGLSGYGASFPKSRRYTMLEFGVAGGTTFEKMLNYRDIFARRLRLRTPIGCLGFDTFEGLPEAREEDVANVWSPGDFAATVEQVEQRLRPYDDFELIPGLFADTLPGYEDRLRTEPPLFVSIDCDYYSSTVDAFDAVIPLAPSGCFFYFDDAQAHYWSDRAGELQAVREVNEGRYGGHLQLCEYPLWIETGEIRHYRCLYRLLDLTRHADGIDISAGVLLRKEPSLHAH